MAARRLTRAESNARWIERNCRIPEGKDVGKPVKLRPWQRAELVKIYDNPHGTRRHILSMGRKNAKTALTAFLLLLHLCGPESRTNSQLYSAAQSREQAAVLFKLAAKCVRLSTELSGYVVVGDTHKTLECREIGTIYRALSADAPTAMGLSPVFIVHDELGQVTGPRSDLYAALETGAAAHDAPLSIVISTQAPTDADLLSVLIDDALQGHDARVTCTLYTAPMDLDPFSEEAIRMANPAFGDFQNAQEVLDMAEAARRMPASEASYRNLVLNQRVEMKSPFVSRAVWMACTGAVLDHFRDRPVYGGLDLSSTTDLTALVLIAPEEGAWHVQPFFWLPAHGLADKAQRDRVPYDKWADSGHIRTTPGRTVEYEFIAHFLRGVFDELEVMQLGFDRWNFKHLRPWLQQAGFSEEELARFVEFGQGFQSMAPALTTLESDILNGKLVHGNHPVLNMCAGNAVVQSDPAGNRKLAKHKSSGRIDGMVALAMARGVAGTAEVKKPEYVSGGVIWL